LASTVLCALSSKPGGSKFAVVGETLAGSLIRFAIKVGLIGV